MGDAMQGQAAGGIFLSYRRDDTEHAAGRLADRLAERFGVARVFMDVDSIPAGADFIEAITQAVSRSDALLVLIGPRWVDARDDEGNRRLDDPDDFVVREVQAALDRHIRVIPILVDGAAMPRRRDLPRQLEALSTRNAMRVDAETFRSDSHALLDALAETVSPAPSPTTPAGPTTPVLPEGVAAPPSLSRWSFRHSRWLVAGVLAAVVLAVVGLLLFLRRPESADEDVAGDVPDAIRVNFQSPDAPTPDGWLIDFGEPYAPRTGPGQAKGLTYGWVNEGTNKPVSIIGQGRDREKDDNQLVDTLIHMEGWDPALGAAVAAAWEIAIPNGRYAVSVSVGDQTRNSVNTINVEGVTAISEFRGSPTEDFQENTVEVTVVDGRLTVDSIGGDNTKINYVVVRPL